MKKYSLKFAVLLTIISSVLTCLITVAVGFFILRGKALPPGISESVREYSALLEMIDEVYIGEFDVGEVGNSAMRATVEALGDPWSYYISPEDYEAYLNSSKNRYAGIGVGVEYDEETGGVSILFVYEGSSAEEAGIVAGDVIVGVDGEYIYGLGVDGLRELLLRPIGESVELTVLKPDGTTHILTVLYAYVFINPVGFDMIDGDIGYVSLANFDEGSAERFINAVEELIDEGAKAFVFDVRSNNGGRVLEMTRILDFLLPEGEIFITVDKGMEEHVTLSGESMIDIPAVVLVDRHSYSAAEYFAATLREYGYAEIVGDHTTGKNRMQTTLMLPSGGALHISTSQYLTRNRVSLFDIGGLEPDYTVVLSDGDYALFIAGDLEYDADPQLQMALSLLR